jgi:DNA replication protein DnaC
MKRITLFAGHYGSGKTCIAVSYAKLIKKSGFETRLYFNYITIRMGCHHP